MIEVPLHHGRWVHSTTVLLPFVVLIHQAGCGGGNLRDLHLLARDREDTNYVSGDFIRKDFQFQTFWQ